MSNQLPGAEALVLKDLRERLDDAGGRGLRWSTRRSWGGGLDDAALRAALAALVARGEAVERDGAWLGLEAAGVAVGTIEMLPEGDAVVRPAGGEPAFFVPARHLGGARADDVVVVERLGARRREGGRRLPEARVEGTVRRGHSRLVGVLATVDGERRLLPFDHRIALEVEVAGADEVDDGVYVVVEIDPGSDGRGDEVVHGRCVEVLGTVDEPGVDVLVVLRHHGIPEPFPGEVLAAASSLPPDPQPRDWAGREDLRSEVIVTIDGPTARDFDDALSVRPLPGGGFRLGVHIADVSHYVAEGSALDLEAYRRGTSVYFPERAVPMLPEGLSNGLCSLRPGVPRLTLSAFLDVAPDGSIVARRFAETVIRSRRRLTYGEVRRVLEEPRDGDADDYGEVLLLLHRLREVMRVLNRARTARGSLDFDLPEGDVVLDTDGVTVGIRPGERNVAHRIVEEAMIAANEAVAEELVTHDVPALYRVHDAPSPRRLEELRTTLRPLGYKLEGELEALHPSHLQRLLEQAAGRPEEPFVAALVLRAQQRALYAPECRGHYALASRYYTHFTSPIRRYPDLLVHRELRHRLRGDAVEHAAATRLAERLPAMGEQTSATERRAEAAERDLLQWKKVRFLASRVGDTFEGTIGGVQPFGLFVTLDGLFVDGLVPVRSMTDDYYVHEAERHELVGSRNGRRFRLAGKVEVRLAGIDVRRRGLDLEIVGMPPPRPPREERGTRPGKAPRRPAGGGEFDRGRRDRPAAHPGRRSRRPRR